MKTKICVCLLVLVVLVFGTSQAMAWVQFKDGQVYNIDYTINDDVWVDYQASGMQTTVNLIDGGYISYGLQGYNNSRINISGGSVSNELYVYNHSQIILSSGSVGNLCVQDDSQVTLSGGSVFDGLSVNDRSQVTLSGGSVFNELLVYNNSQINLSGGIINVENLMLDNIAILTIYGSNFAVNKIPFGFGEITSILGKGHYNEPYRRLTGILANGDVFDNQFKIGNFASINLVPEPSAIVLLITGLIAGGFLLRRK